MSAVAPPDGVRPLRAGPADLDDDGLAHQYGWLPPAPGREFSVRATMIASLDGRAGLAGRSGGLGNPADQRLLSLLRDLADAVLVGAGTIRTEGYGTFDRSARRAGWGFAEPPRLVVVTGGDPSGLPAELPIFGGPGAAPIVLTSRAGAARLGDLPAEIVAAGEETLDLAAGLAALAERGLARIQTEGGPSLLGSLLSGGWLDELCLTIAPFVVGSGQPGLTGPAALDPSRWALHSVLRSGEHLLARYRFAG